MKKIILMLFSLSFLLGFEELYFMPEDGKKAEKRLSSLFAKSKKEIKIAIYTFTNKKLSRALKIASKKGVKITIIADKKESKYNKSVIPNLATIKNIKIYLLSGKRYYNGQEAKMHIKMSIIDNRYLVIGSANYSYSAFYKNYEYILITDDRYLIANFNNLFHHLKTLSTSYRLSF